MANTKKDQINEIKMNLSFFRNMLVAWNWQDIELTNDDEFGMTYFLDNIMSDLDKLSS